MDLPAIPRCERRARVRRVSSARMRSASRSVSIARRVMSRRLPIGVATTKRTPSATSASADSVAELFLQVLAEPVRQARLELADALSGDAELVAELLKCERFFRGHPLVEDDHILALERVAEASEPLVDDLAHLARLERG